MQDASSNTTTRRIAMLIDGDNAQPSLIESVLTEAGKYGLVTIRRIYGDWTTATMSQWKDKLNRSMRYSRSRVELYLKHGTPVLLAAA